MRYLVLTSRGDWVLCVPSAVCSPPSNASLDHPTRALAAAHDLRRRSQPAAIQVTRTSAPKPKLAKEKLVFGATMSDHMLEVDWTAERGWGAPVIVPYHALQLDPAASSLHYGVEVRSADECTVPYGVAEGRLLASPAVWRRTPRLGGESLRRRLAVAVAATHSGR
jgi:hypothetical protein